jgi:AcrR family transcriptional regulator
MPDPSAKKATAAKAPRAEPATRRRGPDDSKTRAAMIDAAAQLIFEEGYEAVTARRLAARMGVHSGLVHYYFDSMDSLLLAVFRDGADANLRRQERALSSQHPLTELWRVNSDARGVKLQQEFMVLAYRNAAIRSEIAVYAGRFREIEKQALAPLLAAGTFNDSRLSAGAASVLIDSLARTMALERALGLTDGHDDMESLVSGYLHRLEGTRTD